MKRKILLLLIIVYLPTPSTAGSISLPQTGQTRCYDTTGSEIACAGTGQDGELRAGVAWPSPRFTVSGDCITDHLTGLIWGRNANLPGNRLTWRAALDYANGLTVCGYSDWRLPNINETESLLNGDEPDNAAWLESQGFTLVGSSHTYWSSTSHADDPDSAWDFLMPYGLIGRTGYYYSAFGWHVRGESSGPAQLWKTGQVSSYANGDDGHLQKGAAWPSPRFTVSGDCVTDNLTSLVWPRNANLPGDRLTWQAALDYANGLTLCGYSKWRLPNRKELMSLIDRSRSIPALPADHPFANLPLIYWSSTTFPYYPDSAWAVDMEMGGTSGYYKYQTNSVWPVRDVSPLWAYPILPYTPGSYAGRSFFYDNDHLGEDIELPVRTPIHAIGPGKIKWYSRAAGYGELVGVVEHDLGKAYEFTNAYGDLVSTRYILSIYGHLRSCINRGGSSACTGLKLGDLVTAETIVGYVNDDAHNGDGAEHLHMGIRLSKAARAKSRDPKTWFRGYERKTTFGTDFAAASEVIAILVNQ